ERLYLEDNQLNPYARFGVSPVYAREMRGQGVLKIAPGTPPEKLVDGYYSFPALSPDGKWLVAIKSDFTNETSRLQLIRRNLQTNEEFPITIPREQFLPPLGWSDAHGKMLLRRTYYEFQFDTGLDNQKYLLDVETGAIELIKGEIRPLERLSSRPLQPTGKP